MRKLEDKGSQNTVRISALENGVVQIKSEKLNTKRELKDLLLYTRRNASPISNPAWIEPVNQREPEDTDALVLRLALFLDFQLEP